jgi:hypothetical protein
VSKRNPKQAPVRPLSDRERLFCQARVSGESQRDAAVSAGYAASRAMQTGCEIEARPIVQAELARLRAEIAERTIALISTDAARVQQELEAVAFSDVGQLFTRVGGQVRVLPIDEWPESARRAVSSVKVKRYVDHEQTPIETTEFRLWSKLDGLKQLREHLGMIAPDAKSQTEVTVRVVRE